MAFENYVYYDARKHKNGTGDAAAGTHYQTAAHGSYTLSGIVVNTSMYGPQWAEARKRDVRASGCAACPSDTEPDWVQRQCEDCLTDTFNMSGDAKGWTVESASDQGSSSSVNHFTEAYGHSGTFKHTRGHWTAVPWDI